MARRGRPRKSSKKVTYQSKETKVLVGLFFLILAILSLLTYFVEADSLVLKTLKSLFGEATFLSAIFFMNVSMALFNAKYPFVGKKSLFGQFLFLLSIVMVFTLLADKDMLVENVKDGQMGGWVGYYSARFFERQIFAQFTILFAFFLMIISIPLMLLMTITDFFNKIGSRILRIFKREKTQEQIEAEEARKAAEEEAAQTPATFGDIRKKFNNFANLSTEKQDSHKEKPEEVEVKIKEEDNGKEMLVNEELHYPHWKLPPVTLLNEPPKVAKVKEDVKGKSEVIEETLKSFGINAKVVDVLVGPTVTQYAIDIPLGIKVAKIANLKNDIALALAVASNAVRIEAPIPGTSFIGIEVPNTQREAVYFRQLIEDEEISSAKKPLLVTVGKNISGKSIITNIQKMPHLLVAGATGSGKSVLTNSFIMSLLMYKSPDEVRFIMVDPKQVELSDYNGIPHLLTPVITDMDKVKNALLWAISEMESRYTLFRESQVRNIEGYNEKKGFAALPYIVIVIDEMADMMMTGGAEIEVAIVRLAQKARATGIHLVLATQRPSVDVITGLIKANIPGRIGMSVATQIDSRVILDQIGAESLLGMGDLLFKEPDKNKPFRVQGVLITQDEIQRVVDFIKGQVEEVTYNSEITEKPADPNLSPGAAQSAKFSDDELFADAVRVVVSSRKGSSSLIQRKLSVGYNRAARLLDELYKYGVVGPERGSKPRDVLISDAESFLAKQDQGE